MSSDEQVGAGEEAGILERLPNVLSIVYYDYEVRHAIVQDATEIIKELVAVLRDAKNFEDEGEGDWDGDIAPRIAVLLTRAGAKQ